jgi:hypothetical protein
MKNGELIINNGESKRDGDFSFSILHSPFFILHSPFFVSFFRLARKDLWSVA